MGDDIPLFGILAKKDRRDIPARAILLQSALSLVYAVTTTFEHMIIFIGFSLNVYTFMTVVGLFVERRRHPNAERPFKVPGYPYVPAIFLLINIWILVYGFVYKPAESLAGVGISVVGLALYFAERKRRAA
jgi:APA family basic amino acid/polyamine antiporter